MLKRGGSARPQAKLAGTGSVQGACRVFPSFLTLVLKTLRNVILSRNNPNILKVEGSSDCCMKTNLN